MWFILSIVASICWGLQYSSYGAKLTRIPSEQYTLMYYFFVTCVYAIYIFFFKTEKFIQLEKSEMGWMTLNVLSGAIASLLITISIQHKNATQSSLVEISYPFFVMFFSVLLFKENFPSYKAIIGSIMIFFGIFLISKS